MDRDSRLLYESYQGSMLEHILSKDNKHWTEQDHTYIHEYLVIGVERVVMSMRPGSIGKKLDDLGFHFEKNGLTRVPEEHLAEWEPTTMSPAFDQKWDLNISVDSDHQISIIVFRFKGGSKGYQTADLLDLIVDPLGIHTNPTLKPWQRFEDALNKVVDHVGRSIRSSLELSDWEF